jgi:electron transport complex protein RnfG
MNTLIKSMSQSAFKLSAFVVTAIVLLLVVFHLTESKIAEAEKQTLMSTFHQVMPEDIYDNDPIQDQFQIKEHKLTKQLGRENWVTVYRARKGQQAAGVILEVVAPNGYSGNIHLLIGVLANGDISGVRVLKHKETPGLGDKIELAKDNWILSFNLKSLESLDKHQWAVKKDGGEFDQFTGATITPRAMVQAVHKALTVIQTLGDSIYE